MIDYWQLDNCNLLFIGMVLHLALYWCQLPSNAVHRIWQGHCCPNFVTFPSIIASLLSSAPLSVSPLDKCDCTNCVGLCRNNWNVPCNNYWLLTFSVTWMPNIMKIRQCFLKLQLKMSGMFFETHCSSNGRSSSLLLLFVVCCCCCYSSCYTITTTIVTTTTTSSSSSSSSSSGPITTGR